MINTNSIRLTHRVIVKSFNLENPYRKHCPSLFDCHYQESHASLARKFPGLKGYTANKPTAINPQETSPYYLIADLYFEDRETMQAAFQSSEGQSAVEDVHYFATVGVTLPAGEAQVYDPIVIG